MIVSVHQPQYLPWIGYFHKILKSDAFVFLDCVQYKTREFQNRNRIRTDKGWIWLTVPVITKGKRQQKISEVLIDNSSPWQRKHILSLETYYRKAEFFERYYPFFLETYQRSWKRLMELNVHIISYILKELSINTNIYFESEIGTNSTGTERIIQICKKLNAEVYLSGIGGKDYLNEERFKEEGINLVYQDFKHPIYTQQFMRNKDDFVFNLSIVDLLFNLGPEKSRKLLESI
ncbi:MAG: WbqC family protein [Candidatus Omnitrophica bacterium]|nr:WbqC family protein [Candidatus Omnitrophota bacterium]